MKWKIVFLASGYCLLVGSSAFVSLEHGIGVAALIGTLHGIVALSKKNGEVMMIAPPQNQKSEKEPPLVSKAPAKATQTTKKVTQIAGLDKNVFKQFQNNLQEHQANADPIASSKEEIDVRKLPNPSPKPTPIQAKSANPYAQAAATTTANTSFNETLEMEQEDKVSLVNKEKPQSELPKKSLTASVVTKPQKSRKAEVSRVKEPSLPEEKSASDGQKKNFPQELTEPLDNVAEDLFADVQITLPSEEAPPRQTESPPVNTTQDPFDEGLGATLQQNHSSEEKATEAAALLKIARNSFQAGHISEAKAGLDNFFLIQRELDETPDWEVQYLYARICLRLGDVATATASFSEILEKGVDSKHPDYPKILESITASLEEHQMNQEGLPFLYDLLNYYRHELDRAQMDVTYGRIERVLETINDDERLIRTYKNHLEIKRILKDRLGESQLLDTIGNRYYKMGEKELSRKYYEENLHLKALMDKVDSP